MPDKRILVVGTTNDYIKLLSERFGDRLLFVTDLPELDRRGILRLDDCDEVVCDLSNHEAVIETVRGHIDTFSQALSGITCFDCESMLLTSRLALSLGLAYPSPESIALCRSKYASKIIWTQNDVLCPEFSLIKNVGDLIEFQERLGRPVVIKPLTGSGSEFVSLCDGRLDCMRAFLRIQQGMATRKNPRMYAEDEISGLEMDPRATYIAEEYIAGREYSCDLIIDGDRLEVIRIAKKFPASNMPVGTIMAYFLPAYLPGGMDLNNLRKQLHRACRVVGLKQAIVMADFMIHRRQSYLLELAPRPGGDCLPELIKAGSGFDILKATLDFAEGKSIEIPSADKWTPLVGMRLPAASEGTIEIINDTDIRKDSRVISCNLKRQPKDEIVLPPEDYELWNLGTVIFRPTELHQVEADCREIRNKLRLKLQEPLWMKAQVI